MGRAVIRYGSVCSGIEAATVAWKPLGWKPVFFAEIEKFPSAVLKHHYPEVPNLGDFTKIEATDATAIDLLVGGTPCQDFSVAGLRAGLDGERGNLSLEFLKLAQRLRPRWVVWENVPGVQSSWTDDAARLENAQNEQLIAEARRAGELLGLDIGFGSPDSGDGDFEEVVQTNDLSVFLEGLSELGYGWSYRILDAQYAGVPQRRRRVFVVGHLGSWERPAAVLFERHSLSGYPPPRREARQRVARGVAVGPSGGEFTETSCTLDTRCKDGAIRNQLGMLAVDGNSVAGGGGSSEQCRTNLMEESIRSQRYLDTSSPCGAVTSKWAKGTGGPSGDECQDLVVTGGSFDSPITQFGDIAGSLTSRHDSSPCADRGMNIVACALTQNPYGDTASRESLLIPTLDADAIAFNIHSANSCAMRGKGLSEAAFETEVSRAIDTGGFTAGQGGTVIAYRTAGDGAVYEEGDCTAPLTTATDPSTNVIAFSAKDHGADASEEISPTLRAGGFDKSHANSGNWMAVAFRASGQDGFTPSEVSPPVLNSDGGGAGAPTVCYGIDEEQNANDELMGCLKSRETGGGFEGSVAYGFSAGQSPQAGSIAYQPEQSPTLRGASSGTNQVPAVAFKTGIPQGYRIQSIEGQCETLSANPAGGMKISPIAEGMAVRRLTPRECERLQGFPDDYTKISDKTADGPRYKAIGNSMARPVMHWIGERIQMVEEL